MVAFDPGDDSNLELSSSERVAVEEELARLARGRSGLQLRVAELLDALVLRSGHQELGFSSVEAYVLERCRRSPSWGREARRFARRLREKRLHRLRAAVRSGDLGMSMAELLARTASSATEGELIARARTSTVRELCRELTGREPEREEEPRLVDRGIVVGRAELAVLTASRELVNHLSGRRVSDESFVDALLGEGLVALQTIAERTGRDDVRPPCQELTIEERLAKAQEWVGAIDAAGPSIAPDGRDESRTLAGVAALDAARLASAVAARAPGVGHAGGDQPPTLQEAPDAGAPAPDGESALPQSARALDAAIVAACKELAERDVCIGELARRVAHEGTWRSFGLRSFDDYVRERLGLSPSSIQHRLSLVRRLDQAPLLRSAIRAGEVGYEAALLLARAVGPAPSPELVEAWVERARCRTVKHLREEVHAVQVARAYDDDVSRFPPDADDLQAVFVFEQKVLSGELVRPYALAGVRSPSVPLSVWTGDGARASGDGVEPPRGSVPRAIDAAGEGPAASVSEPAPQPSVAVAPVGHEPAEAGPWAGVSAPQSSVAPAARETSNAPDVSRALRWRLPPDLYALFSELSREYHRVVGSRERSFVSFLCAALWETWLPFLEAWDDKWKSIYLRDRVTCTSPVCERRDVTLHHVRFRSQGGGDEPENLTSLCAACHLEGIHRGRLRAQGPSHDLEWLIGREPILSVRGRDKRELAA
jgi:hypothetical protein